MGYDIRMSPDNPDVLYVTDAKAGVFKSTYGGISWKATNTGLLNRAVNKLALSGDGLHLYAASEGMGVFRLDLNSQPPVL